MHIELKGVAERPKFFDMQSFALQILALVMNLRIRTFLWPLNCNEIL